VEFPFLLHCLVVSCAQLFGTFVVVIELKEPAFGIDAEVMIEEPKQKPRPNARNRDQTAS
jgi:hypothetical protein